MSDAATDVDTETDGKDTSATLRKMLRPAKGARGVADLSLERVTDEVFRKTAKSLLKLDLVVDEFSVTRKTFPDAWAGRPKVCLNMSTTNEAGVMGMVILDGALIDGLIEQQLLGHVAKAPRADRPVTRIDAELSRRFITEILKAYSATLKDDANAGSVCGFSGPVMETDLASLKLTMTASAYSVLSVFVDLGPGQKSGQAQFWFPVTQSAVRENNQSRDPVWEDTIRSRISGASLNVRAFLPPIKLPLSLVMNLKEGEFLPVPLETLARARLKDVSGNQIATGRIGQLNGARAFRVETSKLSTGAATMAATGLGSAASPLISDGGKAMPDPAAEQPSPADLPDLPELPSVAELQAQQNEPATEA